MRWSFRIARVAGIDVRIHVTFFLLLAFWAYVGYANGGGLDGAVGTVVGLLVLFSCVLLHEFGHALVARRFDIRTPDITLLPIGGVARMQRMPDKPSQELWIALAGPAVNVVIVALIFLITGVGPDLSLIYNPSAGEIDDLVLLATINTMLVLFNLLPAFPMDGGRVLRALLAMKLRYGRATQIAARIGQGFAFALGFWGLLPGSGHNPLLVLIAFFVFLGASQEAAAAQFRDVATGMRVSEAMITQFATLPESAVLDDAVEVLLRTSQHEFPVLATDGRVRGVLTRDDMIAALKKNGPAAPVADFMRRDLPQVHPLDSFDEAFRQMQECKCPALPVVDSFGRLVGLITPENVGELMLVHSLRPRDGTPAWRPRRPGETEA